MSLILKNCNILSWISFHCKLSIVIQCKIYFFQSPTIGGLRILASHFLDLFIWNNILSSLHLLNIFINIPLMESLPITYVLKYTGQTTSKAKKFTWNNYNYKC